ncbi:uncharacterized protein MYCFIDRAFT_195909 [Pseudocercospora fijiensis CIRAD86]|uniref:Uncharacterized protein n=1 Tax=Pseudocercospora fijiensis (strain CIRAD86) TaxID=383855 RepID=M3B6Q3_PSEFD|nr:uncharacterized protein MYCFIDRAFT_195909 [Pseudocercospora fijiensis CIRAD86]EME85027.1 hypothetical protein MYCFIDRAFT_195909 [Pseudocercospora fijiensis CIRAD86]
MHVIPHTPHTSSAIHPADSPAEATAPSEAGLGSEVSQAQINNNNFEVSGDRDAGGNHLPIEGEPMTGTVFEHSMSSRCPDALTPEGESFIVHKLGPDVGPFRMHPNYNHVESAIWAHGHRALGCLLNDPDSRDFIAIVRAWMMVAGEMFPPEWPGLEVPFQLAFYQPEFQTIRRWRTEPDPVLRQLQLRVSAEKLMNEWAHRFPVPESDPHDWTFGVAAQAPSETGNLADLGTRSGGLSYLEYHNRVFFVDRGRTDGEHGEIVGWRRQGRGFQFAINFARQQSNHYMLIKCSYFGRGSGMGKLPKHTTKNVTRLSTFRRGSSVRKSLWGQSCPGRVEKFSKAGG